jgi:uncharacterized membrane protein YfcA
MTEAWALLSLSGQEALFLALICLAAGIVRGFSGFALSALVMAIAVSILPPVELIPLLWFQEMAASILMARGGWRDANRMLVALLVAGTWMGWPIGLYLTTTLPVEQSKMIALTVILVLSALQLGRLRIPGLTSRAGTLISGAVAGVISGLAHVGGMVVALYVLAQGSAARSMRGTLVLFLFVSSIGGLFIQLGFGVMDGTGALRGLAFAPATLIGVMLGTKLFSPKLEPYYRPFCLGLLIVLALVGLIRMWVG